MSDLLNKLVDRAAKLTREGTFSERNPALGKMVRCVFCRRRRRLRSNIPCCTAKEYHPEFIGQIIEMRGGQKYEADSHGAWKKI